MIALLEQIAVRIGLVQSAGEYAVLWLYATLFSSVLDQLSPYAQWVFSQV